MQMLQSQAQKFEAVVLIALFSLVNLLFVSLQLICEHVLV